MKSVSIPLGAITTVCLHKYTHMRAISIRICLIFFLASLRVSAQPTFTFECLCTALTQADGNCDICNATTQSRSFRGLLIRRNGQPHRWIDEPYIILQSFDALTFRELIPNGEQIRIDLAGTAFSTIEAFRDSTRCQCLSGVVNETEVNVDTPIIGDGSPLSPITIGQFGADTTMYLRWTGAYWFPSKIRANDIQNDLPWHLNDGDALAAGLKAGDTYLLAHQNTLAMPTGLYKVVVGCGFSCTNPIRFFISDQAAQSNGIPAGQKYALYANNPYGVLYGFVKAVYANFDNDTLSCEEALPAYSNDQDAILGGLQLGDFYQVAQANDYGAPKGVVRLVSTDSMDEGDADLCCSPDATLPYFDNDADAIAGGVGVGGHYFLSAANTYGWPAGTQKIVQ